MDTEVMKKEIIDGVKGEIRPEIEKIVSEKAVGWADFEKFKAEQNKSALPVENTGMPTFQKWFRNVTSGVTKAVDMAETGGTSYAGYTVPVEYNNIVFQLQQKFARIAPLCTQLPMKYDVMKLINLATDVSVAWLAEGASITETQATFGQPTLTANKLAIQIRLTRELLDDTSIDMQNFLFTLVARAQAKELDNQIINGTGAPFTGVLNAAGTVSVVSSVPVASVLNYDDLINVMNGLSSDYSTDAVWTMHRSTFAKISQLKTTYGEPLIRNELTLGQAVDKYLLGTPYIITERGPHTYTANLPIAIFGDWKNVVVGVRKDLAVRVLQERYADTDEIGLQFIGRWGITVALPNGFVLLKTAAA